MMQAAMILIMMVSGAPTEAENWRVTRIHGHGVEGVRTDTIKGTHPIRYFSRLQVLPLPYNRADYLVSRIKADCDARTLTVMATEGFTTSGSDVFYDEPERKARIAAPDSPDALVLAAACEGIYPWGPTQRWSSAYDLAQMGFNVVRP